MKTAFTIAQIALILIPIGMLLACGYYINAWYDNVPDVLKQSENFPSWVQTGGLFLGFYGPFIGAGLAFLFAPEPIDTGNPAPQGPMMAYLRDVLAILFTSILLGIPVFALAKGEEVPVVSSNLMTFLPIAETYVGIFIFFYLRQKLKVREVPADAGQPAP